MVAGSMVACSPEEFEGLDQAGVPQISNFADQINVVVDQNTNQVTFTLNNAQAVMPYWEIELGEDKKGNMKYDRSTANGYERIFATAGDYTVNCRVANRNGISVAAVSKTFHIDNTIIDFGPYLQKLSKAPWYIDNEAQGHMGCGESGTDGLNWWSAAPNDKADWGVYDNSMIFTADYQYTFDPGASGTIYVNNGVSMWPEENVLTGDDGKPIDFTHAVSVQNTTYALEVDGSDLYITFPEHTCFPYIANDDIWNSPRYKVLNMDSKSMELVIDNGSIAWHYLLTNSKVAKFNGFTYDQADNLWKKANVSFRNIYYAHTSDWQQLPEFEHSEEDGEYHVVLPTATDDKWQAQYQLATTLTNAEVPADATYDMSLIVRSSKTLPGMTVKLTDDNDEAAIVDETFEVPGGEDYIFYVTDKAGIDLSKAPLKLVFDFGKNPDDCDITIKQVVLIDHSKNTELNLLPSDEGGEGDEPAEPIDWDESANLLSGHSFNVTTYYSHGDSWEVYPEYEHSYADGVHEIFLPSESNSRWQAQYTLEKWGVALSNEKTYDFRVKIETDKALPGVTVKLTQTDDDNTFLTEAVHVVEAGESWIEVGNMAITATPEGKGVIDNLKIVFDFGGNAAETTITLSDLLLQEH